MDGFELPPRKKLSDFLTQEAVTSSAKGKNVFAATETRTPRKGKCWTEEEHLAFLAGLQKLGKGNWTGIARYYVPSRTSTQIASHAQKYLQRLTGATKRKSRFSDIEEQVHSSGFAQEIPPVSPIPDALHRPSSADSAPTGRDSPQSNSDERFSPEGVDSRAAKAQRVCKPTAVKASCSEPDLLKLAESLMALSKAPRGLNASETSAFKRASSPLNVTA